MKHLKKFEYFGYGYPKSEEEEEMMSPNMRPSAFEEEEEEEESIPFGGEDDFYDEDRFEFDETDEEGEGEFDEEEYGSDDMGGMSEGMCPSCKCSDCKCGGGSYSHEMETGVSMNRIKSFEAATKPDFLDLDKDGDKKESMKKAAADKKKGDNKNSKKDVKETPKKGGKLSKAQEKLPPALRKAIASGVRD